MQCFTRRVLRSSLKLVHNRCLCNESVPKFESQQKTHFGFEEVTRDEKQEKVHNLFSNVARKYDFMNDVMSAGIHRLWKDRLMDVLDPLPSTHLLDIAGGTGDIAFRFVERILQKEGSNPTSSVVVCDINENMLRVGEERAEKLGYNQKNVIKWVTADAQNLPFPDNTFDAITTAFGIRNVVDIQKVLDECHRVLKPGGMFLCLEFSNVSNEVLKRLYDWYSFEVIPVMGEVIAGDYKSYQYLVESIRRFPDQKDFKAMIVESGFTFVEFENLMAGIAAIHTGFKK